MHALRIGPPSRAGSRARRVRRLFVSQSTSALSPSEPCVIARSRSAASGCGSAMHRLDAALRCTLWAGESRSEIIGSASHGVHAPVEIRSQMSDLPPKSVEPSTNFGLLGPRPLVSVARGANGGTDWRSRLNCRARPVRLLPPEPDRLDGPRSPPAGAVAFCRSRKRRGRSSPPQSAGPRVYPQILVGSGSRRRPPIRLWR